MVFIARQEPFVCEHCGFNVEPLPKSYRNHCPECLYSKHVDLHGPGDRLNTCQGLLRPVGLDSSSKKGYIVLYECETCAAKLRNKCAQDDKIYNFTQPKL